MGQQLQFRIADLKHFQFLHRRQNVVAAGPRTAVTLSDIVQLLGETELSRILTVATVDNIAKRVHALLRIVIEPDPAPGLAIHSCDLFAGAEIFDCFRPPIRGHPISDAATIAAAVNP